MTRYLRYSAHSALLIVCSIGWDDASKGGNGAVWRDAVTYRMPQDATTKTRVTRAADWLKKNLLPVSRPGDEAPLKVIAWKDPTLEGDDPKLLAGYAITDTLWAAKALKLFDPPASQAIEHDLQRIGWYGNGLHDVLFHSLDKILHRPDDLDFVHGHSLGRFPTTEGRTVDLRVFRQRFDPKYDVGHPSLFAEHAVYRALFDFWKGRNDDARRRIRAVVTDDRATQPNDCIFWDADAGILVDYVNYDDWRAFHNRELRTCRHFTFKLGVLLYAIRLLGMEQEITTLEAMKQRLWSAQRGSGGVAHFVIVDRDGKATKGFQPTGEATAIAILAEVVESRRP
jgi:hypothetical protein